MSDQLYSSLLDACDYLEQKGVALPDEIKQLRRRDKREPGRRHKEEMEGKLSALILRRFRRQRKRIVERLELYFPDRKVVTLPLGLDEVFDEDPEEIQDLIRLLTLSIKDGIILFEELSGVDIDDTLVNADAAEWARK